MERREWDVACTVKWNAGATYPPEGKPDDCPAASCIPLYTLKWKSWCEFHAPAYKVDTRWSCLSGGDVLSIIIVFSWFCYEQPFSWRPGGWSWRPAGASGFILLSYLIDRTPKLPSFDSRIFGAENKLRRRKRKKRSLTISSHVELAIPAPWKKIIYWLVNRANLIWKSVKRREGGSIWNPAMAFLQSRFSYHNHALICQSEFQSHMDLVSLETGLSSCTSKKKPHPYWKQSFLRQKKYCFFRLTPGMALGCIDFFWLPLAFFFFNRAFLSNCLSFCR